MTKPKDTRGRLIIIAYLIAALAAWGYGLWTAAHMKLL